MSPNADYSHIRIESTLPKPWEMEQTFNDTLYEWMSRAPWLAISAAAHLLFFFILMAVPWEKLGGGDEEEINAQINEPPEEPFEEPEEEIEEEIEEEPLEEPILKDAEISDHNETEDDQEFEQSEGDPDFLSDSPFDSDAFNDVLGIGGGAGGKYGNRLGGRRNLRAAGGAGTEQALREGLDWLKNHQDEDGRWDADEFMKHDPADDKCDGPGHPTHDVGLTGLALLAFLGDGNTTQQGQYKATVARGVAWLKDQQDLDTGLFGDAVSHDFIYDHALATLAMCEAYFFSKSPIIKSTAQMAVNYIHKARNPYKAWRYDVPPLGDNDSSVTGWMVFALASGKDAKLIVDPGTFDGALAWFDEVTDPVSGRCGYESFGSASSRTPANEHFPRDKGEAMTAVALLCRFFMGQDPAKTEIMVKHAELLRRTPPLWEPDAFGCDMYYWYYGTYAMFQMGGKYWSGWNESMKQAVVDSQRHDGASQGSWNPAGPWGYAGGRVYSTALMVLCLEVYFRYSQVLGAR
ncbi:MAG: hypothetical protein AB1726_05955 [Planctomycetota bacterium]